MCSVRIVRILRTKSCNGACTETQIRIREMEKSRSERTELLGPGESVCELTPGRPLEVRAGAPARSRGAGARGAGRNLRIEHASEICKAELGQLMHRWIALRRASRAVRPRTGERWLGCSAGRKAGSASCPHVALEACFVPLELRRCSVAALALELVKWNPLGSCHGGHSVTDLVEGPSGM